MNTKFSNYGTITKLNIELVKKTKKTGFDVNNIRTVDGQICQYDEVLTFVLINRGVFLFYGKEKSESFFTTV